MFSSDGEIKLFKAKVEKGAFAAQMSQWFLDYNNVKLINIIIN